MTTRPKPAAADQPEPQSAAAEALGAVLQQLIAEHEGLVGLAGEYRLALAGADVGAMESCLQQQAATLSRIHDLEVHRQQVVRGLMVPTGSAPAARAQLLQSTPLPTLSALAARLQEPVRARLLSLGERLREVLNRLHGEHAVIREAAETLGAHMEGVLRHVCRNLSHAGVYGPRASIDTRSPVVTSLDVRS